jgi:hypothetical protein
MVHLPHTATHSQNQESLLVLPSRPAPHPVLVALVALVALFAAAVVVVAAVGVVVATWELTPRAWVPRQEARHSALQVALFQSAVASLAPSLLLVLGVEVAHSHSLVVLG